MGLRSLSMTPSAIYEIKRVCRSVTIEQCEAVARRALAMVAQMDKEGFGNCTNQYECEAVCPKEISVKFIAQMNREYFKSLRYKIYFIFALLQLNCCICKRLHVNKPLCR